MSGQRWDAMMVREYTDRTGEVKSHWTKIGAAFENKNGSIGVQLDALPVDGKVILQIPLSREERAARYGGQQSGGGGGNRGQRGGGQQQRYQQRPQRFGGQPSRQATPAPEYEPDAREEEGPWAGGSGEGEPFPE